MQEAVKECTNFQEMVDVVRDGGDDNPEVIQRNVFELMDTNLHKVAPYRGSWRYRRPKKDAVVNAMLPAAVAREVLKGLVQLRNLGLVHTGKAHSFR